MKSPETREFERGASGDAPGIFSEAFRTESESAAREAGYRAYIENKNLVEQMRESQEAKSRSSSHDDYSTSYSSSSESEPSKHPGVVLTLGMTIFLSLLAFLLYKTYYRPNPPTPPICSGAHLIELKVGDVVTGKPLLMECSTGWIRIPYGSSFYIDTGISPEIHYVFSDGSTRHVTSKSQPRSHQFPTHEFRIWGKGTPTFTVREKSR